MVYQGEYQHEVAAAQAEKIRQQQAQEEGHQRRPRRDHDADEQVRHGGHEQEAITLRRRREPRWHGQYPPARGVAIIASE